ncbi:MAG: hypothetical protein SPF21_05770 [Candidatus Methanomethylophilaceae archaeon]|nr:hypothetical protein [Candidatus Methanomethylophilaceae archaeon]
MAGSDMDAFDIVLKAGKVFDTGLDLYLSGAVSEDHLGGPYTTRA